MGTTLSAHENARSPHAVANPHKLAYVRSLPP
jgi:hypothetical protein